MQALLLGLHADWYAIELSAIREVVPAPIVTPLPGAPPALLGVFNLRGEVVPLYDTAALLALAPGASGDRVVVAETEGGPAGLTSHQRPERVTLGGPAGPAQRVSGVARYAVGDRVATLLDVEHLLDRAA